MAVRSRMEKLLRSSLQR